MLMMVVVGSDLALPQARSWGPGLTAGSKAHTWNSLLRLLGNVVGEGVGYADEDDGEIFALDDGSLQRGVKLTLSFSPKSFTKPNISCMLFRFLQLSEQNTGEKVHSIYSY